MRAAGLPGSAAVVLLAITVSRAADASDRRPVHTSERFTFRAEGRPAEVFPLFGADRERLWAPQWEPRFLWPAMPMDRAGMVFEITHGEKRAIWVNTVFDAAAGKVQYVYVLPAVVATVVTLDLRARGAATDVVVRYERTSLSSEADALVKEMAKHDHSAGPEWASRINAYLDRSRRGR